MYSETEFILYIRNQQKSRDFYQAILNVKPVMDVPGMTEFILSPGTKLGLMPEKNIAKILGNVLPDPESGSGIPRAELYLLRPDYIELFQRAKDRGALIISEPLARDWGHIVAYASDPDGHVLAFAGKI